jgi:biopolymer transport protein ExbB
MTTTPYGLMNLWQQGDFITKTVAVLLLTMSVLSWSVIIIKSWRLRWLWRQAAVVDRAFWQTKSLEEGLQLLEPGAGLNPFHNLTTEALSAAAQHIRNQDSLEGRMNIGEWLGRCLHRSIENIIHALQSDLPLLASVGSTAPFVGLFGTVWGIYHALVSIGVSGQASIDKVAGPVGEALIMTAFGLAVAIPAVLGYNALTYSNRRLLAQIRNFAHDLNACLLTGEQTRSVNTAAAASLEKMLEGAAQ